LFQVGAPVTVEVTFTTSTREAVQVAESVSCRVRVAEMTWVPEMAARSKAMRDRWIPPVEYRPERSWVDPP